MILSRIMRVVSVTALMVMLTSFSYAENTASPPAKPNPPAPRCQHVGEQYGVYDSPGTGESIPYRLFVPSQWKPGARLPLLVTLRAGNSVNNSYREPNSLVAQAEKRGYLVVTPMGYRPLSQPYYGSPYRIARPNAAEPAQGWTPQENERAEQDVMNVIDLVSQEYGVDPGRVFLHGQNPSGSGALYLGAKYPDRFAALVISSGPIDYSSYPFDRLKGKTGLMVIHGDQDTTNPIEASMKMAGAAKEAGVNVVYATVPGGTHLAEYLTFASQIFDFLDTQKK